MNCAHCHAHLDATTGWTMTGERDRDYPAGTMVCMSRKCMPDAQRPAPGATANPGVR